MSNRLKMYAERVLSSEYSREGLEGSAPAREKEGTRGREGKQREKETDVPTYVYQAGEVESRIDGGSKGRLRSLPGKLEYCK